MSSRDTSESQSASMSLRSGHEQYGARVRNRVIIGFILVGAGFLVSALWYRFPHDTLFHKFLVCVSAVCFGAAEFTLAWARLLWRRWLRGKPFTRARLWFELMGAVLFTSFFAWYLLAWRKW